MSNNTATQTVKTIEPQDDPRLSAGTKEFLKALNSPAPPELEKLTPVEARKVLVDAQMAIEFDYSGIEETEKIISVDGFEIKLNIARPAGTAAEKLPVFLFIHGGGWVLGDYPTHRRMVRDLVLESGAVAVFVNYTPTPDAVYPQQINEIYAALKWISENIEQILMTIRHLSVALNLGFEKAVGKPGEPGNIRRIVHLASRIADGYAQVLEWTLEFHRISVEPEFEKLMNLASKLSTKMLTEIEEFSEELYGRFQNAFATSRPGDVFTFTLTLTAPDITEYLQELERLRIVIQTSTANSSHFDRGNLG